MGRTVFSAKPAEMKQQEHKDRCNIQIRHFTKDRLQNWAQVRKVYGSADDVLTKLLDAVNAPVDFKASSEEIEKTYAVDNEVSRRKPKVKVPL